MDLMLDLQTVSKTLKKYLKRKGKKGIIIEEPQGSSQGLQTHHGKLPDLYIICLINKLGCCKGYLTCSLRLIEDQDQL